MRPLIMIAALSMLPSPVDAHPATLRERVEASLMGIEASSLPDRAALLRLSPAVDAVLRDIVEHPSPRALARTRALWALRDFPCATTSATLRRAIQASASARTDPARPAALDLARLDLQQALTSYATVVGPGSLAVTAPFLSHASVDVRRAAAAAVALSRSPAARALLVARQRVEPSAMVRHHLARQIASLPSR